MNKKVLISVAILIAVGFFLYAFNLNNGLFWDDDDWIINNTYVHDLSWSNIKFWFTHNTLAGVGLQSNYYRPFLFLTFAINYVISGIQPFTWHLVSNGIHIINAVLIFILLRRYAGNAVSFLTALIFTIHPLQTEAVTYISGRGDPLVTLFMLLALLLFVKSREVASKPLVYKLVSILFLILGIFSRETGIVFPFILVVFYIAFLAKDRFLQALKKGLKEAWPYFAVVFVYGLLRLTALNFQNTLNFYTAPNPYSENLHYRMFTFMHVLIDYFRLLFAPVELHMERGMTVHTSLFQWPVWLGALIVLSILYIIVRLYKRGGIQNQSFKVWFFGAGVFFIALGPVSGITPINAVIYEHWLYLPMVGFWFIISFYLVRLLDYFKSHLRALYYGLIVALIIYFSFFSYQTIQRNIIWGKPIEFFEDILKYEPQSVRVNNNLGNLYFNKGDLDRATEYYKKAADIDDVFAQPHFNLGSILQSKGDIFGAIQEYEKAISIDPTFHYAYQNLIAVYASRGDLVKAAEYMETLKQLKPFDPRVFYNSALINLARNDRQAAYEDLEKGLKVSGSDKEAYRLIVDLMNKMK